ncbi:hypothetical protein M5689_010590 [Euphorbia peplus]|nr:hypothetical protein M5689_010590 [Euphorbia peplus]
MSHQKQLQLLFQQRVKDKIEEEDEKTEDGRLVEDHKFGTEFARFVDNHEFGPETEEENDLQYAIRSFMVAFKYVELAEWTVDDWFVEDHANSVHVEFGKKEGKPSLSRFAFLTRIGSLSFLFGFAAGRCFPFVYQRLAHQKLHIM